MRRRPLPTGAKARGPCPVCGYRFKPATDAEWRSRVAYHEGLSLRHKRYTELAAKRGEDPREAGATLAHHSGGG